MLIKRHLFSLIINSIGRLNYEYYYLGGKESEQVYLNHADEYESLISAFRGDELNWYSLDQ